MLRAALAKARYHLISHRNQIDGRRIAHFGASWQQCDRLRVQSACRRHGTAIAASCGLEDIRYADG